MTHRGDPDEFDPDLRQTTDQQLEEIFRRSKRMLAEDDYLKIDYEDLVERIALRFHLLVYNEQVRRRNILTCLQAELRVVVGEETPGHSDQWSEVSFHPPKALDGDSAPDHLAEVWRDL